MSLSSGHPASHHEREMRQDDNNTCDSGTMAAPASNHRRSTRGSEENQGGVSALVAKSKKAAASLWTLLHAKVRFP